MNAPLRMSDISSHAEQPEILKHYGVKGMRWGVRKDRSNRPNRAEKKQDERNPNVVKTKTITIGKSRKKVEDMTDDELKTRIERLQMEQRLKTLESGPQAAQVTKGKTFANRMLEMSGEILVRTVATAAAGLLVNKAFKSASAKKSPLPPPLPGTKRA